MALAVADVVEVDAFNMSTVYPNWETVGKEVAFSVIFWVATILVAFATPKVSGPAWLSITITFKNPVKNVVADIKSEINEFVDNVVIDAVNNI